MQLSVAISTPESKESNCDMCGAVTKRGRDYCESCEAQTRRFDLLTNRIIAFAKALEAEGYKGNEVKGGLESVSEMY